MLLYPSSPRPRLLSINLLYVLVLLGLITAHKKKPMPIKCSLEIYDSAVTLRTKEKSAQICGGVLLQAKWVLTAAHCVYDRRNPGAIVVMGKGVIPKTKRVIEVSKIYLQDVYDPKTLENDVSLLYLTTGFPTDIRYAVVSGTDLFTYTIDVLEAQSVILTWKGNRPGQSSSSKVMELFCISVSLLDSEECVKWFKSTYENDTMFCTSSGPQGEQPCKGDSGSPIFVAGVVMGLVSFGLDCDVKNAMSIFGRVDRAIDFIENTVRSHGHGFGNKTVGGFLAYYVQARGVEIEGTVFVVLVLGLVPPLLQ